MMDITLFFFFKVPCLFQVSAITALQTARSFVVLSNSVTLMPYHVDRLSVIFIHWRPIDLFPSIFPVVTRCSNVFFLMVCPINLVFNQFCFIIKYYMS